MLSESKSPGLEPSDEISKRRIHWRPVALGLYALAFFTVAAVAGLPAGREWLVLWIVGALALASIGQARGPGRMIRDFLPLVAVLLAYDILKGRTYGITGHVFSYPQIRVDEWLFGGTVPTVTLQRWLHTPRTTRPWDYFLTLVYLSYFFVPIITAAALWKFAHQWYARFALMLTILAGLALLTYCVYPATPPWLAAQHHEIPHVARVITGLASRMHVRVGHAIGSKSTFVNPIAAVPSLHFALTTSLALFFWSRTRRWRWLLVAYPITMGFALVYLGEHYVFDLIVGGLDALVAYVLANAIVYRLQRSSRIRPVPVD